MGFGAGGSYARAAVGVLFIALAAARLASPLDFAQGGPVSSGPLDTLTSDLAARIAASITPGTPVKLEVPPDDVALEADIANRLSALGVRVLDAGDGVTTVRVSCLDNLRERACSAEIAAATRTTLIVTRPLESGPRETALRVGLELRPILSQRARILDLARFGDAIFVLSPHAVVHYTQMNGNWRGVDSRPVSAARPWPRDVRGRLRATTGKIEAFLPGVTCTGIAEPMALACVEGNAPWPVEIESAILDATRNYFETPEGLRFYGIARLSGDAGARWLAATVDETLVFVDDSRQSTATAVSGDDVVTVRVPCAAGSYVVASSPARDRDADRLTLFRVERRRLVPAASAAVLPGKVTALWPTPNADAAIVITYDRNAGRYDAHELAVSCSR